MSNKKILLIALIFAILSVFFAYIYISDLETKYKVMTEPVKVVVASQVIPQGTVIKQDMLLEKYVPKEYAQPRVFNGIKELFLPDGACEYISLNTIEENEQVLSSKLSKINEYGISNLIPEGKKAISITFDMDSIGILSPGSKIDIFAAIEYTDSNKQLQETVFSLVQNVLVLAVGNNYIGAARKQDDEIGNTSILTLALSTQDAQKVILFSQKGSLKYLIRPTGDTKDYDIDPLKVTSVIKDLSRVVNNPNYTKDIKLTNQKEVLEIINKYASMSK
ncbi:MAG: Flp pilus assembly protein CpaB [Endomicrobium sp.]|jgi:pilus assembly protein CpaB|uniref:Flp pilus assembly protein CpaB n=1 Tax=Candidatus Endomicrobiellum cubanum TaxID=3242325 RepID=UPI00282CC449|nr:Flp pilus assembly protein CpaB [Endomicrobium sp.]MDR2395530.1 Flp pilus assembly protein CpaB [Endomicrobium sp.]